MLLEIIACFLRAGFKLEWESAQDREPFGGIIFIKGPGGNSTVYIRKDELDRPENLEWSLAQVAEKLGVSLPSMAETPAD